MRIGIDFDNTIANYDGVFFQAALEKDLIPNNLNSSKNSVRDYLNNNNKRDAFTELQGYVYGARMDLAKPYEGFNSFLDTALQQGHTLYIVSHKSKKPLLGPEYNLHDAALQFLMNWNIMADSKIARENIFFEIQKELKIERIKNLNVDVFIDDLPDILKLIHNLKNEQRYLFDPHDENRTYQSDFTRFRNWSDIKYSLLMDLL